MCAVIISLGTGSQKEEEEEEEKEKQPNLSSSLSSSPAPFLTKDNDWLISVPLPSFLFPLPPSLHGGGGGHLNSVDTHTGRLPVCGCRGDRKGGRPHAAPPTTAHQFVYTRVHLHLLFSPSSPDDETRPFFLVSRLQILLASFNAEGGQYGERSMISPLLLQIQFTLIHIYARMHSLTRGIELPPPPFISLVYLHAWKERVSNY